MARHDKQVYQYYSDPWPYAVIDNYFTDEYYKELYSNLVELHPKVMKTEMGESMTYGDEKLQQYVKEDLPYLKETFPNHKPFDELYIDAFLFSHAPGFDYYIHNDMPSKVFGISIYMGPTGVGTKLYSGLKESDYVKTVEWKPNRAVAFALDMYNTPSERTFHSYGNPTNEIRDSINVMYRMKYDIDEIYPELL